MTTERKPRVVISRSFFVTLVLAAFSLGIFIGSGVIAVLSPFQPDRSSAASEYSDETFKFIRQVQRKDDEGQRRNRELRPFRYKVNAMVEEKLKKNGVTSVSVYFRDLNNGNWFGIREKEKFSPKNNLKLPLMIAYFKQAESNPFVLRKSLLYNGNNSEPEQKHLKPVTELGQGKRYAVNDLIFRMIAYDDPAAYSVLLANMPPDRLDKVFKDLNVEYDPHSSDDALSLRGSAAFYRVLFNASYLNEEMSEKALRYLSKSYFKDGMASAVPQSIEIASKFGERIIDAPGEDKREEGKELYQTHEFGIIYHPHRPFLIGIMARGDNFDELTKTIRDITRLVYDEVDRQS